MALPSTMHGVTLYISDIDRGVYASADLRVAPLTTRDPRPMLHAEEAVAAQIPRSLAAT